MEDPIEDVSSETLLEETGGCGLFQTLILISVAGGLVTCGWSVMLMSYGNYNPGWHCADSEMGTTNFSFDFNITESVHKNTTLLDECDAFMKCQNIIFSNEASTLVTEFNLLCDHSWVASIIPSLKMAGILVGTLGAAYLNDWLGRKACYCGSLVIDTIFNVISAFSVNWQMYAVLQFLHGIVTGSILLSFSIYPVEFVVKKWRIIIGTIPFWNIGGVLLSCAAMLLRNWRYLHLACAGLSSILALSVFCIPESFRWLSVRGELGKAIQVVLTMARYNRRKMVPMNVIHRVLQQIKDKEKRTASYGIRAVFQYAPLKTIFAIDMLWLCMALASYTIYFNLKSLSGDFYINLLLAMVLPMLSTPFVPLFSNTIGRKRALLFYLGLIIVGYISLIVLFFSSSSLETTRIITLALTIVVDACWGTIVVYSPELFPTVLRAQSQSMANSCARFAAAISPFVITKKAQDAFITYIAVLSVLVITWLSLLLLPETKDKELADLISCTESEERKEFDDRDSSQSLKTFSYS